MKGGPGYSDSRNDRVLWFRNWTGLQSVRGLEHVHVLVRDAPRDLLEMWVGDRPRSAKNEQIIDA